MHIGYMNIQIILKLCFLWRCGERKTVGYTIQRNSTVKDNMDKVTYIFLLVDNDIMTYLGFIRTNQTHSCSFCRSVSSCGWADHASTDDTQIVRDFLHDIKASLIFRPLLHFQHFSYIHYYRSVGSSPCVQCRVISTWYLKLNRQFSFLLKIDLWFNALLTRQSFLYSEITFTVHSRYGYFRIKRRC